MIFVIYPLFKYLARRNKEMVITFIYVFTVIIVITFAIEIGQKVTNTGMMEFATGQMEFADIMYGLVGFLVMFTVFCLVRYLWHQLLRFIRWLNVRNHKL